jgi:hypothetical protein
VRVIAALAIVAAHAAVVIALVPHPPDLVVTLDGAGNGSATAALADRVHIEDDGSAAGLQRRRWSVTYRGDYTRRVGASRLVGPFQDPAHPPCGARVVVGQGLLDAAVPLVARALDDALAGETNVATGDYKRATAVTLQWAQLEAHAGDVYFASEAAFVPGGGYLRVTATLVFDRVSVPIVVAFVPELSTGTLGFHGYAQASLSVDNRVLDWLASQLGGDRLVTAIARHQLDNSLAATLAPPPPFALPGGGELRFVPCGQPDIHDHSLGALGFAVVVERGGDELLPPHTGATLPPATQPATVALDLDIDALDAVLYALWRSKLLDRELADVGLDRRFAADPTVAELLSVRISPVTVALPPTLTPTATGLRLAVDARATLTDGDAATTARLYGALAFAMAPPTRTVAVDATAVELACEDRPNTLRPCYADLVAAIAGRTGELHGALTQTFGEVLAAIFVDRHLSDPSLPAELVVDTVTPAIAGGTVHLDLAARLQRL